MKRGDPSFVSLHSLWLGCEVVLSLGLFSYRFTHIMTSPNHKVKTDE